MLLLLLLLLLVLLLLVLFKHSKRVSKQAPSIPVSSAFIKMYNKVNVLFKLVIETSFVENKLLTYVSAHDRFKAEFRSLTICCVGDSSSDGAIFWWLCASQTVTNSRLASLQWLVSLYITGTFSSTPNLASVVRLFVISLERTIQGMLQKVDILWCGRLLMFQPNFDFPVGITKYLAWLHISFWKPGPSPSPFLW